MKKTIFIFGVLMLSFYTVNADCYEFWLEDYDDAERQYEKDLEYCKSQPKGDRQKWCTMEANKSFNQEIHDAGIDFYRCTFS